MDENEQEFIEDFGAKSAPNDNAGGVPVASQKRPTTAAKRQGTARSSKTRGNGSP